MYPIKHGTKDEWVKFLIVTWLGNPQMSYSLGHETTGAWAASRSGGTVSQLEVDIQVVIHRSVWKTGLEKTTNRLVLMVVICRFSFVVVFFCCNCFSFCFWFEFFGIFFSRFWSYVTSNITAWSHVGEQICIEFNKTQHSPLVTQIDTGGEHGSCEGRPSSGWPCLKIPGEGRKWVGNE